MEKQGFRGFFLKYFDILENIFMLTFALGLYLTTQKIEATKYVMWLGITVLTLVYLLKSFDSPKQNFFDFIIYKFAWMGLVLALFGIMSKLLLIEKSNMLLWISFIMMLIGFAGGIQRKFEENEIFDKKDYWRLAIVTSITFLFAIL
jgi:hypothetical protein